MSDEKSPVERLLDTFVYAPIGFLLNLDEIVPQLVEKGHQQVDMARMFGQFAVEGEGRKRVEKLQSQAREVVGNLAEQAAGLLAGAASRRPSAGSPVPEPEPEVAEAAPPAGDGAAPAEPAPSHDELAIPDYDSLSASQVVPRLDGLSPEELDGVRRYEAAHRGRKTILSKIAQLTG